MNWAITKPIKRAMGGEISGLRQKTKASKKMTSLVVILLSSKLFLGLGVAKMGVVSSMLISVFDSTKINCLEIYKK